MRLFIGIFLPEEIRKQVEEIQRKLSLLEFAKQHKAYYRFVGLSPEPGITAEHQRIEFAKKLQSQFNIPPITSDDWNDLFN